MSEEQESNFYTNFQSACNSLTSALLNDIPLSDNEKISISNELDDSGNIINKFYNSDDTMIMMTKFTYTNLYVYVRKWNT